MFSIALPGEVALIHQHELWASRTPFPTFGDSKTTPKGDGCYQFRKGLVRIGHLSVPLCSPEIPPLNPAQPIHNNLAPANISKLLSVGTSPCPSLISVPGEAMLKERWMI
uniref:Uncharacterized protein n=1 Tax=Nelumbo nucifera TaxID=4432 RepID=A0A822YHA7_NELNU|nr:TPA_asm: hypothetical protein HUJ06_010683 [Nelumbo nucifera]